MISLLLPIGPYSFFVRACIGNIFETCGSNDLDVVVLISKNATDHVRKQLEIERQNYTFRILEAPFATNLHLDLLDWALYEADISNWFMVQHADLIWRNHKWFDEVQKSVQQNPNATAICCTNAASPLFLFNNQPTRPMHDYCGIYQRSKLLLNDWPFMWGKAFDLPISTELKSALTHGNLYTIRYQEIMDMRSFLDGSKRIQLEIAVRQEHIPVLPIWHMFIHFGQIFRVLEHAKINKRWLIINRNASWACLMHSSYVSSMLIEQDEIKNIIPLAMLWKLLPDPNFIKTLTLRFKEINKYADQSKILGFHNDLGLRFIKYRSSKKVLDTRQPVSHPTKIIDAIREDQNKIQVASRIKKGLTFPQRPLTPASFKNSSD